MSHSPRRSAQITRLRWRRSRPKRLGGMNRFSRRRVWVPILSLSFLAALVGPTGAQSATSNTTENDAITFGAATWVDLQRVTGADPLVDVDSRGNGRVFVNFPWGRLNTPTLPNIVARSLDGGDTFRTLFDDDEEDECATGNSQPHCNDPGMGNSALALSPDNDNVYLSGIVPGFEAISASASSDAGDTWPNFNPVITPGEMDRPWLLAPGGDTAYLAWNNLAQMALGQPSVQYATTQNGGASWTVDTKARYATSGAMTRLVMDRSAQSPARGAIYQVFGKVDPLKVKSLWTIPEVGIAVSTDDTKTFQTYTVGGDPVGGDLACGTCLRPDGGTDYRGYSLPWVTVDTAGNLYAVWGTGSGSDVVMSTSNISDPKNDPTQRGNPGSKWSPKVQVSTGAAESAVVGNVVAGSPGNIAIVYYGTNGSEIPDNQPDDAKWYPFVAHSSNALRATPAFTQSVINHRAVHTGGICTYGGGSCDGKSRDRGLRNWMNVGFDADGRLYAAWSDDNNDGRRTAIRFAKQLTGPSLMAGEPPFDEPAPSGSMTDPSGDATWPNRITGGTNLPGADLTRVALRNNGKDIRVKLSVGNANQFQQAVDAVPLADRLLFVVRFQSAEQDYFAAYEYSRGGAVRAFTGRIDAHDGVENGAFPNAIAFVADDSATATVDGNTITITQQLSAFEGLVASPAASPPKLLSVVGSALIGPSELKETRFKLLNTLDATRAFDSE